MGRSTGYTYAKLAGGITHLITETRDDMGRSTGYTYAKLAGGVTHLITETRDDMGRSTGYTYAKLAGGVTHLITETRDDMGRSTGYTYAKLAGGVTHLITETRDDMGRSTGYTYAKLAGGVTHLITETRDDMGRSTGYTYAKNGATQQTVTTGYGTDGRISTAGFLHQGAEKQFGNSYLPGTNLLQTLTMPNSMTLTQSYETQRDLLTGMYYKRGTTGVVEREYSYDTLGRPITRRTARKAATVNDTFAYSNRSELTEATVSGASYSYAYDNIGNRTSAQEAAEEATAYTANALNQYTAINDFAPTYDADGNQTLVKTSTGIWTVAYNAENRPITFTNNESNTVIECAYDYMGRRATKQVTENGNVTLKQRYIYRGYLQIACCALTRANHPCLWLITWDPTQPVATRPLVIQKNGTWYCYGWDLTKNICEVFGSNGYINTTYTSTPYGEVTSSGSTAQPLQWSSEYSDAELGIVYYNYRFYNSLISNWLNRDYISERQNRNSYNAFLNAPINHFDLLGLSTKGKDFDGYHPKLGACNAKKDCIYNYERLREWIIAAINRRRDDFTHEWVAKGNKANWDKHRNQYKEILKQAGLCLSILEEQLRNNKYCPRLPQYDSVREWREEYDKLDDPGEYPVLPDSQVSRVSVAGPSSWTSWSASTGTRRNSYCAWCFRSRGSNGSLNYEI